MELPEAGLESVEGETLPITLQAVPRATSALSDSHSICVVYFFSFFPLNNTL